MTSTLRPSPDGVARAISGPPTRGPSAGLLARALASRIVGPVLGAVAALCDMSSHAAQATMQPAAENAPAQTTQTAPAARGTTQSAAQDASAKTAPSASRGARPADGWPVAPFAAHYIADWRGINVGTSDLQLETDTAPGSYQYTWTVTAHGVFRIVYPNDVIQQSWFSISGDHVRPEKYHAQDGTATATVDFDWHAGRARGETEKKPVDLKLNEGVQDIMSIQIEVMLDLANGNLPKTFSILDKDELKAFNYTLEGPAKIRTALGELDTLVVASQRTGNDRILRMWFAPSLNYVPVRAERSRAGKVEFTMKIKTLKPGPT